jgi:hypothetical protein
MNMKKYLFSIMTAAAILTGCVSDEMIEDVPKGREQTGNDTYATFSVALSDPITRTDLVNDEGETDLITSIRILVYQDYNTLNSVCESDILVMASDRKSATLQITSGWKRILVIANDYNKPWRLPNQTGKTIAELLTNKTVASGGRLSNAEIDFGAPVLASTAEAITELDYSTIAAPKNMVFSNSLADSSSRRQLKGSVASEESIAGVKGEADNHFTIYVKRAVAKVTASFDGDVYPIPTSDGKGTLSNVYWGIRNLNRAVALFQMPHSSGKPLAPFFYELTGWNSAALKNQESYKRYWWARDVYKDISYPLATGISMTNRSYYIPENANFITQPGNTTYLAVKGVFTPASNTVIKSFVHSQSSKFVASIEKGSIDPGTTFYRITGIEGTNGKDNLALYGDGLIRDGDIFSNPEDVLKIAYIAEHFGSQIGYTPTYAPTTLQIDKYIDGICYYRVDIQNGDNCWVERNKAYHGKISGFTSLGDPNMNDIEATPMTTSLTSIIQVIPWEEVIFGGVLKK